jgi:hypothetical protein
MITTRDIVPCGHLGETPGTAEWAAYENRGIKKTEGLR